MTVTTMHDGRVVLHQADCRDVLRGLADNSIDSVVTDPPYALVSIQKRFGKPGSAPAKDVYGRGAAGFMGKQWDTGEVAFSDEFWAEVLRVLKPGGHVVAFSGTRTYHRMAVAIEDAGFEIRDQLGWVYGSGFPKSHDVSKGIDRVGGMPPSEQAELLRSRREAAGLSRDVLAERVGCTPSSVRDWEEGRARASGGAVEHITPSKAYRAALADLLGYSADERRLVGVATDRREDGTVYGVGHSGNLTSGGHTDAAAQWQGWGTALKPAWEPICLARKPLDGTVAENVLEHGTGAINVDGCRVAYDMSDTNPATNPLHRKLAGYANGNAADTGSSSFSLKDGSGGRNPNELGRWPANIVHDGSDEVLAAFPDTKSGLMKAGTVRAAQDVPGSVVYGVYGGDAAKADTYGDSGSAARFFYCAKASRADRDAGLEGFEKKESAAMAGNLVSGQRLAGDGTPIATPVRANTHPTVKPTSLMQWLCRLVTPPGGVILDPFMGSGSTGKAAALEGFRFVGCEREDEYMPIAVARIAWAIGAASKEEQPERPAVAPQQPAANDNDLFSEVAA